MSSEKAWLLIGGCAIVTFAIKAAGPVALGNRPLPGWFNDIVRYLAPALLAALVSVSALTNGHHIDLTATTAGVGSGGLLLLRGASVIVAVLAAAAVTAGLRAV